jgi:hypothetical protein
VERRRKGPHSGFAHRSGEEEGGIQEKLENYQFRRILIQNL